MPAEIPMGRKQVLVLEGRTPARGQFRWLPIPAYTSFYEKNVWDSSAAMRVLYPEYQFRVKTYGPEKKR
jgi:hypothetical protein